MNHCTVIEQKKRIEEITKRAGRMIFILLFFFRPAYTQAHTASDSLSGAVTLQNCVRYALAHQPSVEKSLMDEEITERSIKGKLADWYPQVNFNYYVQHFPEAPTSIGIAGGLTEVATGLAKCFSRPVFSSLKLFLIEMSCWQAAVRATCAGVRQSKQSAIKSKSVAEVSKAFYAVLVTQEEIELIDEDIVRLERSLKDAYDQYKGGIADKTDYKRATILLNNAKAEKSKAKNF